MKYIKGISNHANTLSRYPVITPEEDDDEDDNSKTIEIAAINIVTTTINGICLTMEQIKQEAAKDEQYKLLIKAVKSNSFAQTHATETPLLKEFFNIRQNLSLIDGLVMYNTDGRKPRSVIPRTLRKQVVRNFHSANQGATSMLSRARQMVYWPGMDRDITNHVMQCQECRENAPSQQKEPLIPAPIPDYPFQNTVADLFEINKTMYLVYADRLTGFVELAYFPSSPTSSVIINTLREYFHRWGVPEEISLDGGPNLNSLEMKTWLKSWGVQQRLSSAYYPQSNGRAEAAVKSMKRLLLGNTGSRGNLNTDELAQALLQHRNTPVRGLELSPAQLALGRNLRDTVPLPRKRYLVDPKWAQHLRSRERAMSAENIKNKKRFDEHSKELQKLNIGDEVLCQNTRTKKWEKLGIVVEVCQNRQYNVKMIGSGRISLRNRKHLRKQLTKPPIIPQVFRQPADQLNTTVTPDSSHHQESSAHSPSVQSTANGSVSQSTHGSHAEPSIPVEPSLPVASRKSTRFRQRPIRYRDENYTT